MCLTYLFTSEKSKILADKLLHFWSKDLTVRGRTDKELGDSGMGYRGWGVGYSLCLLLSLLSSLFVLSVRPILESKNQKLQGAALWLLTAYDKRCQSRI